MKGKLISEINSYEVLAPAGSFECMKAAFNAGADAVYVGGNMFGARAFAGNFDDEELKTAIDYAHIRGKKLFLTVNTLLKNQEIERQLFDYIRPLYERGLDAVIVQDFGVLIFIRENFPELDVHASTQMTVTGSSFAKELKQIGVTRIVPARELLCSEIKEIYEQTGLEIECFVHGALCYSYSGQCLLSSIIGGRSGNRGRCAQPCRLPYDIAFKDMTVKKEYPLSPKDLCTLQILPDILESGVYSLKIEGRMKKPEYVALVTSMYRKYVDLYVKNGRNGYRVEDEDIEALKDIYNRGGFTDGYYKRQNDAEMMSLKRPNHMGTVAAKIINIDEKKRIIYAKACKDIDKEDVLEIFLDNQQSVYVDAENIRKNSDFVIGSKMLKLKSEEKCDTGQIFRRISSSKNRNIMRTRNNMLIREIEDNFLSVDRYPVIAGGSVVIYRDMPVSVDVWSGEFNIHIDGCIPEPAGNRPVTETDIKKQFLKTGGTDFVFDENQLTITVDDGLFINIKELNRLRREALDMLRERILSQYRRIHNTPCSIGKESFSYSSDRPVVTALVSGLEQLNTVVLNENVNYIYVESDIFPESKTYQNWHEIITKCHENGKEIYMALPYITRDKAKEELRHNITFLQNNELDGYVFRNMETFMFFKEMGIDVKKAVFDNTIYAFNNYSLRYLERYSPFLVTGTYELNNTELGHLECTRIEMPVYGYIPVMVTAGCLKKSYGRCDGKKTGTMLKDRLGNSFSVINHCNYCYNVIYNSKPLMLTDLSEDEVRIKPSAIRYNFVSETAEEIRNILCGNIIKEFTRGHFKRGVE